MARVEAGRDDRASLAADAAASKCRAAADAVRDTLANAHREFTTRATLDEQLVSAATDAFDGRMARLTHSCVGTLGTLMDATEAQLLKRNHGKSLSNLLAFLHATAVARSRLARDAGHGTFGTSGTDGDGDPEAALALMLLLPRAENARVALVNHYRDDLTRCIEGPGTGHDPRTALATGALYWLGRPISSNGAESAAPHAPSFDELERVLAPHVTRAVTKASRDASKRQGATHTDTTRAALDAIVDAANSQLPRLASLPTHLTGEVIARLYARPAAKCVGDVLDGILDTMAHHPRNTNTNGYWEACVYGVMEWGETRALVDEFVETLLPKAVNAAAVANTWSPTLALRDAPSGHARLTLNAVFNKRREAYELTLRRVAFPSAAAIKSSDTKLKAAAAELRGGTSIGSDSVCVAALREASGVVTAIGRCPVKAVGGGAVLERAAGVTATCVGCLAAVARVIESALNDESALNETETVTERGDGSDDGSTIVPAPSSGTLAFEPAWSAMSAAVKARGLARKCEKMVLEGCPAGEFVGSVPGSQPCHEKAVLAARTAGALVRTLDGLAGAAEARAIRALLRPTTLALEGAAAQTWSSHRKPESMPKEPKWSPHVTSWTHTLARAVDRLATARSKSGIVDAMIRAMTTLAAAEVAGVYLRLTPSRAWRDRFAWDTRAFAAAVYAAEASVREDVAAVDDDNNRRAAIAKALVTRAALLRADTSRLSEVIPEVATYVGLGMANVVAARVGRGDAREVSAGHPWGPGPSPEELWERGVDDDEIGDGQSRDDAWRWLPKEALEPWPRTGEGLTDLTRAWAEVEATLVRTAPVGAVHSALWRRSELLDDDRTPLDETEAAGREAMRAEIERHRGAGTRAVEVDEDAGGFGGWGDGVEYY